MLDLKTVKNITISEGSVTKITNSSGVVLWQKVVAPSASLDVDLNNQWVASTKTLDGYNVYMSNSNKGVNNGYASMKFKFKGMPDFKIWINSYAESNYDYTIAWDMDKDYPTSNPSSTSSGAKASTNGKQKDPTSISNFIEVDYPNDGGEHFVVVTYRKDVSVNNNDDRGYVAVKLTLISTTWVVSATEFVKKDGKYYEKLTEVGTYEGGVTANTGNYKEGNELHVTYKQGSADDYMITDGKMYYKNYIYVTPVNTEINTGDYIQGDYIGEVTPSMKVTYTDNTEKAFYELSTIDRNTDSNKANAKNVVIYDSVTTIGLSAFEGCSKLESATIPNSVTSIGSSAFYNCSSLSAITIPNGVTSIGSNAFSFCSSLSAITIPNRVTSIGSDTFYDCSSLSAITIPNGVTSIGSNAFYSCSSLSAITIPNRVTRIEFNAFANCTNLASVTIENSASKISYRNNAFANIASSAKLYVPSNLLADYQADSAWTGAFKGGIFAIGEQVRINMLSVDYDDLGEGDIQFTNITSTNSSTIPSDYKENVSDANIYYGITSIGDYTFNGCLNLTNVKMSYSVKTIGKGAFFGCSGLYDITLPYYVTSIGDWAFEGCSGLHYITVQASNPPTLGTDAIPSGVTTIYVPASSVNSYKSAANWSAYASKIKAIGS